MGSEKKRCDIGRKEVWDDHSLRRKSIYPHAPTQQHASFVYQLTRRVAEFALRSHNHSEDEANSGGIRDVVLPKKTYPARWSIAVGIHHSYPR